MTAQLLVLSETVREAIEVASARAHPLETGGVLIGVYAEGRPWVTQAVEIASPERGRSHYQLPGGTTRAAVKAARLKDPRLGYLGDWHSHPKNQCPSGLDLASLALISYRRPSRPNPTLLVVRRTDSGYDLDGRRIVGAHVRSCEIRLAGSLPSTAPES